MADIFLNSSWICFILAGIWSIVTIVLFFALNAKGAYNELKNRTQIVKGVGKKTTAVCQNRDQTAREDTVSLNNVVIVEEQETKPAQSENRTKKFIITKREIFVHSHVILEDERRKR